MAAALPETTESISRTRILAAARQRFERRGFRATSISAIARAAGVAVGTIYLYFKNKEQILVALFDESNARWMDEARSITEGPDGAEERLVRLAYASNARYERDLLLRSVMTRDLEVILAPLCDELRVKVMRETVELIVGVIREGIRRKELRALDADKAAYILWTTADALFMQTDFRYEELLPVYIAIVSDGLRQPSKGKRK
jgi:TetR/AcrR family transcriptional regulator, fatty acid metabolism regulator protein